MAYLLGGSCLLPRLRALLRAMGSKSLTTSSGAAGASAKVVDSTWCAASVEAWRRNSGCRAEAVGRASLHRAVAVRKGSSRRAMVSGVVLADVWRRAGGCRTSCWRREMRPGRVHVHVNFSGLAVKRDTRAAGISCSASPRWPRPANEGSPAPLNAARARPAQSLRLTAHAAPDAASHPRTHPARRALSQASTPWRGHHPPSPSCRVLWASLHIVSPLSCASSAPSRVHLSLLPTPLRTKPPPATPRTRQLRALWLPRNSWPSAWPSSILTPHHAALSQPSRGAPRREAQVQRSRPQQSTLPLCRFVYSLALSRLRCARLRLAVPSSPTVRQPRDAVSQAPLCAASHRRGQPPISTRTLSRIVYTILCSHFNPRLV